MSDSPIFKYKNRKWSKLDSKGDNVGIKDPKLKQGYLDLANMTVLELEDALERIDKTLKNKALRSKLKDKGESLQKRYKEVAEALANARNKASCTRRAKDIHGIEWTGEVKEVPLQIDKVTVGSEEELHSQEMAPIEEREELNPLKLMAHHSSCLEPSLKTHTDGVVDDDDPAAAIAKEVERLMLRDAEEAKQLEDHSKQKSQRNTSCASFQDFGTKRDKILSEKYNSNAVKPKFRTNLVYDQQSEPIALTVKMDQDEALERERRALMKETESALSRLKSKTKMEDIKLPSEAGAMKYRDMNVIDYSSSDEEEFGSNAGAVFPGSDDEEEVY